VLSTSSSLPCILLLAQLGSHTEIREHNFTSISIVDGVTPDVSVDDVALVDEVEASQNLVKQVLTNILSHYVTTK
jgi:hypothetical protein